ncbi:MAG: hypothetical protein R2882_01210 [Gemmatimonadales bacterium]
MTPASIFRPAALALLAAVGATAPSAAQSRYPERAIRRDIPITNAIRRALAAGSRDSTGRPTRRYWQLRTDYTIRVSLDPATQRLTGTESVVIHNASPTRSTRSLSGSIRICSSATRHRPPPGSRPRSPTGW